MKALIINLFIPELSLRMNKHSKSFTVKYAGTANALITQCGISQPYDPITQTRKVHPEVSEFKVLWDTGATSSVVAKRVVDSLNLFPIGKIEVHHANGKSVVNSHFVNVYLPNQITYKFIKVSEGILGEFDILIGMDIISTGDFAVTNSMDKTTFSFRHPSLEEIDFVKNQ